MITAGAENTIIQKINAVTGGNNYERYLIHQLKDAAARAKSIDIVVSFLMVSGVRLLISEMKAAVKRGVKVRMLSCDYLGITEPAALWMVKKELGETVELRLFSSKSRSFHAKSYIFHYENGESDIFVGSSNLSKSALTYGFEWNYRLESKRDINAYSDFMKEFEELFYNHAIVIDDKVLLEYSRNYHEPLVVKDIRRYESKELGALQKKNDKRGRDYRVSENSAEYNTGNKQAKKGKNSSESIIIETVKGEEVKWQPRGVQIEALYRLADMRNEGCRKALLHAATGVGKTAIAGFDAVNFGAERVLFLAHRIEILQQAENVFSQILQTDDTGILGGGFFDAAKKHIFASVSTLGQDKYLNAKYFSPESFDYIVVDEFHHAVNDGYLKILDYFKPEFMLGLTATPDRMDGRDIYRLCDYNVAYEINLCQAINRGMLVPFHYYGIYDETAYDGLKQFRGHYKSSDLELLYLGNIKREKLIYRHYLKYSSQCAIGFCVTRKHAKDMAKSFCRRNIPAAACYSNPQEKNDFIMDRDEAIAALRSGRIKVLFTVDMFNEGVDIPEIDMVMFLRPTESPVVFLQQLGRGLRKSRDKEYLNVLDFIGNYKRADKAPILLSGKRFDASELRIDPGKEYKGFYPDNCIVDFDLELIDLFNIMKKRGLSKEELIEEEFTRIVEKLGKVPDRCELFLEMDDKYYILCKSNAGISPFKNYLKYLHDREYLTEDEKVLYNGIGRELINFIESTSMSKVYKMPVLLALYNGGQVRMELGEKELLTEWKKFFKRDGNYRDLLGKYVKSREDVLRMSDKEHLTKIKNMPCKYLIKSGKGIFEKRVGSIIALHKDFADVIKNPEFVRQMKDAIEYRALDYYRNRYGDSNR